MDHKRSKVPIPEGNIRLPEYNMFLVKKIVNKTKIKKKNLINLYDKKFFL
tara:strand:+ start:874 stop:1023 length:150 start_codon:yes stop_codon:yes gene_type:complete